MSHLRWSILLNSLSIALELAAGFAVNSLALISAAIAHVSGVRGVHYLHVWSLGSDLHATRVTRPPALS